MNDVTFLRPLVWMDYRLAILFTVIAPLVLLLWSVIQKKEAMQKLLIIYWRVASLLMITVYLMIPGWKISFLTGIAGRILIPLTLWFWVDLNEEIRDLPQSLLKLVFTSWRWAVTVYSLLGVAANSLFIPCGFSADTAGAAKCQVLLEAPRIYRELLHAKEGNEGFLGFLGACGLCVYIIYLVYFLLVRLGKQGRSALEQ
ncbi:MAG: DUF3177 family protein [Cyanobacteria bacterium P01_F01_bin.143]